MLVGYSSGATLVYAVLAQAPPDTFSAALSMGFCPDLAIGRPLFAGHGLKAQPRATGRHRPPGQNLLPTTSLQNPWIAFQGTMDQVCAATDVEACVRQVHGRWWPQLEQVFARLPAPGAASSAPQAGGRLADLLARVETVALIGPGERASFEFHLSDWLGDFETKVSVPVRPEVEKLHGPRIVCIHGADETSSPCRGGGAAEPWQTVVLTGGHHVGGHYRALADHVAPETATAPGPPEGRR